MNFLGKTKQGSVIWALESFFPFDGRKCCIMGISGGDKSFSGDISPWTMWWDESKFPELSWLLFNHYATKIDSRQVSNTQVLCGIGEFIWCTADVWNLIYSSRVQVGGITSIKVYLQSIPFRRHQNNIDNFLSREEKKLQVIFLI